MTFEEELALHGSFVFTAQGDSMRPLIRPARDLLEITRRPAARLRRYDVALYKRDGRYILHRVLAVRPEDYVFAGDNNRHREYGVTDDMILGVLTGLTRDGAAVDLHGLGYRCYVRLWCAPFPLRAALLYGIHCLRKIAGALKKSLRRLE